jgi:hypothetical protein
MGPPEREKKEPIGTADAALSDTGPGRDADVVTAYSKETQRASAA